LRVVEDQRRERRRRRVGRDKLHVRSARGELFRITFSTTILPKGK
jgi:hypothetical protein